MGQEKPHSYMRSFLRGRNEASEEEQGPHLLSSYYVPGSVRGVPHEIIEPYRGSNNPIAQMRQLRLRKQGCKLAGALLIQTQASQPLVLLPTTLGCPFALLAPQSTAQASLGPAGRPRLSL